MLFRSGRNGDQGIPQYPRCPSLFAARVLLAYGKRWSIEDMFNQLNNRWGWKEAWQQSRRVLHQWSQIVVVGYGISQLLNLWEAGLMQLLADLAPGGSEIKEGEGGDYPVLSCGRKKPGRCGGYWRLLVLPGDLCLSGRRASLPPGGRLALFSEATQIKRDKAFPPWWAGAR